MVKQIPKVAPKFQKYETDDGEGRSHNELFIVFMISFSFRFICIAIFIYYLIYKIKFAIARCWSYGLVVFWKCVYKWQKVC